MTQDSSNLPKLILSARPLLGEAAASPEERRDAFARFNTPESIRDYLAEARQTGFRAILTLGDERILAALKLLKRQGTNTDAYTASATSSSGGTSSPGGTSSSGGTSSPGNPPTRNAPPARNARAARNGFHVLPIIPNVLGYVREATEYGLAGAGMRRLLRVGPLGFLRVSLVGALNAPKVLRKDFPTLLSILYELEMGEFHQFAPPAVFLHHQMTDLALSFGNRAFFENYAVLMRERFHTEPGLVTSNFALLAARLTDWDVPIRHIVAPFNRAHFLMPGGLEAYQRPLESGRFRLIADRLSPEFPTPTAEIEWALCQPQVSSVVVEWGRNDAEEKPDRKKQVSISS